jgi:hypothetical protein
VPLNAGCLIQVTFPTYITLGPQLTSVIAFGLPNAQRTMEGVLDYATNSYTITNGCPAYRDNTNTAIIIFSSITNPFF